MKIKILAGATAYSVVPQYLNDNIYFTKVA